MYRPPKQRSGCYKLIAIAVIATVAFMGIHHLFDRSNYTKGHQAYQQMDCVGAILHFDSVINHSQWFDWIDDYRHLAVVERAECVSFQNGIEKEQFGDSGGALIAYFGIISGRKRTSTYYQDEGLNVSSPLVEAARNKAESVFSRNEPSELANEQLCDGMEEFLADDLIPRLEINLPLLYFACGQFYQREAVYASAIDMYEQFQSSYPNHYLSSQVEVALAHSIVAAAEAGETGELPSPERSGTTSDGTTAVIIQNDSPEQLRIVFTGPEARIEELQACSSCSIYYGGMYFLGASCPETIPTGRYTLKSGSYNVVVESISGSGTIPWRGYWTLETGGEYSSCFYIVKSLSLP